MEAVVKTLVYWVAVRLDDNAAYSVRALTRKECSQEVSRQKHGRFEKPRKVVVRYAHPLDIVRHVCEMGEW